MKKILIILILLIYSFGYGQITVHNTEVEISTVPKRTTNLDSLVLWGSDKRLKHVEWSDLLTELEQDLDITPGGGLSNDHFSISTDYTTLSTDNGRKGIVTGGNITLDDAVGITAEYELRILNSKSADITWTLGSGQSTKQYGTGAIPALEDDQYAYIELIADNVWSIVIGGQNGAEIDPIWVAEATNVPRLNADNVNTGDNDFGLPQVGGEVTTSFFGSLRIDNDYEYGPLIIQQDGGESSGNVGGFYADSFNFNVYGAVVTIDGGIKYADQGVPPIDGFAQITFDDSTTYIGTESSSNMFSVSDAGVTIPSGSGLVITDDPGATEVGNRTYNDGRYMQNAQTLIEVDTIQPLSGSTVKIIDDYSYPEFWLATTSFGGSATNYFLRMELSGNGEMDFDGDYYNVTVPEATKITFSPGTGKWYLGVRERQDGDGGVRANLVTKDITTSTYQMLDDISTFDDDDEGVVFFGNSSSAQTFTLPDDGILNGGYRDGWHCTIIQRGTGQITIERESVADVLNVPSGYDAKTSGQFAAVTIIYHDDEFYITGSLAETP